MFEGSAEVAGCGCVALREDVIYPLSAVQLSWVSSQGAHNTAVCSEDIRCMIGLTFLTNRQREQLK